MVYREVNEGKISGLTIERTSLLLSYLFFADDAFVFLRANAQRDFLEARRGATPSWIWSSLLVGRELLEKGLGGKFGSGIKVKFWNDKWVPTTKCAGEDVKVWNPNPKGVFSLHNEVWIFGGKRMQGGKCGTPIVFLRMDIQGLAWQDKRGQVIGGTAYHISAVSSIYSEADAWKEACILARQFQNQKVVIKDDCKVLIYVFGEDVFP
ncbi:unnamed protein product [Ilex paraguariensis]|uniref:RNase H type-1 domain-containing protein n=1 Tax=Ilex paraguariensis TaxID=185542 RepID=A0ABC8UQP0_9AQUA